MVDGDAGVSRKGAHGLMCRPQPPQPGDIVETVVDEVASAGADYGVDAGEIDVEGGREDYSSKPGALKTATSKSRYVYSSSLPAHATCRVSRLCQTNLTIVHRRHGSTPASGTTIRETATKLIDSSFRNTSDDEGTDSKEETARDLALLRKRANKKRISQPVAAKSKSGHDVIDISSGSDDESGDVALAEAIRRSLEDANKSRSACAPDASQSTTQTAPGSSLIYLDYSSDEGPTSKPSKPAPIVFRNHAEQTKAIENGMSHKDRCRIHAPSASYNLPPQPHRSTELSRENRRFLKKFINISFVARPPSFPTTRCS